MARIRVRRIYEPAEADDGMRILVDRIWPRGVSKERSGIDVWMKEVAPSTALRKWFDHQAERWTEFEARYAAELEQNQAALQQISSYLKLGTVTLLYSARDESHNQAVALRNYLVHRAPLE